MKILIVDDEPDVLLLCRVNLAFDGHEIIEASDAPEALVAAVRERPDVIVLDVMLPRGNGLSVLETLQARQDTSDIPVILLTAKARDADEARGFRAGASVYIRKPFAPATLADAVRTVSLMTADERRDTRERSLRRLATLREP